MHTNTQLNIRNEKVNVPRLIRMSPGSRPSHGMRGASTTSTPIRTADAPRTIRKRPRSCIILTMPHPPDGEKHRDTVRASFDKQAVEFAASPVMTDAAAFARLVTWGRVAGGERVLDVACGPGLVAAAFAPHVASVIGVDLTPAMLARGTAIVNERGIPNVAFALADVERLPFPGGCFDRVVSRRAFHHFPDAARVLAEMARVCMPGGAVVIEDQAPPADPAAADAMTTIDRLRDPSHTRAVDPGAWEALCAASDLELGVLLAPLLHTPDQITDRPLVTLRVMRVPGAKGAERVVPTGTLSPAGVERTVSPARPVAVRVSAGPQTFAIPPPPQICGAVQVPQMSVPPQPSRIVPQFFPWAAQVVGVQVQPGMGAPTHAPPAHASPEVQGLPSLQGRLFGVFTQPIAGSQESSVQALPSLQLSAGPPTHTPAVHTSAVVQALPSLQSAMFGVAAHVPAPLQAVLMHALGLGLGHGLPAGSNLQVAEQQSPFRVLPSSHCSPRSTMPLPQVCATFPMIVENWFVRMPPAGSPGPTTRKKFWPQLLPVTVCGEAGLPIVPGGGGTGPVANRRNGPTRPRAS